ncbi:MAG: hypothetical protein JW715_15145 [Sedimentisphaerales bacterium]|nr:hypothetical protein [Sedimentisphaerales bacterium]
MKKLFFNAKSGIIFAIIFTYVLGNNAMAVVDLCVTSVSVSNRPYNNIFYQSSEVHVTIVIDYLGGEVPSSITTIVYADDYVIATETQGPYGIYHVYCTLPEDIPYGEYTISAEVTCIGDSNPDNNSESDDSDIIVGPLSSNIWLYDLDILNRPSDNIYDLGQDIDVECFVQNVGDVISDSYIVNFYLEGYFLGSESRSPLEVDGYDIFSTTVSLPEDLSDGSYNFWAEAICSNDDKPNDNVCSHFYRIKIVTPYPDLTITKIDVDKRIFRPGDSIVVSSEIENIGNKEAEEYSIEYFAGNYNIGSGGGCCLDPYETDSIKTTCKFPDNIPAGYYLIWARADCSEEISLGDNEMSFSSMVWVGPYPDLKVEVVDAADGVYMAGDEIVIYSLIKNIGDEISSDYTIDYYISDDVTITESDSHIGYNNRVALLPNVQHSYSTTCKLPPNIPTGDFYVGVIVTCPEDYDYMNNTDYDNSAVGGIHPSGYVCGRIEYRYSIYNIPVRYASLEIYDNQNTESQVDDLIIGQTHTDHNGNYGVVVSDNVQGNNEIYVKVFTKGRSGAYPGTSSMICDVRDEVFGEIYFLESPLYPHPQDSSVVIDMRAVGEVGAFLVYDSIVEGFHKAKTFFDIEMEDITTYWPNSYDLSFYDPERGIFIAENDKRDRDVIMHEYGHYIAQVCNFTQGSVGDNPMHYWDEDLRCIPVERTEEQARNLTFREAWATLFSIATQYGDTRYPYSGDTMYQDDDIESGYTFKIDLEKDTKAHNSPGQYYENMNTCALWDIFDDNCCNEDNLDVLSDTSLSKTWSVFCEYKPEDIIDFWNGWLQLYDSENDIRGIFLDHEMDFVE